MRRALKLPTKPKFAIKIKLPNYQNIIAKARRDIRFRQFTPAQIYQHIGISKETALKLEIKRLREIRKDHSTLRQIVQDASQFVNEAYTPRYPTQLVSQQKKN